MDNYQFNVYPAIDLRGGQVVRLQQGDPERQTTFSADPAAVAVRWWQSGAGWLHVVNLDGAFGEADARNQAAVQQILAAAPAGGQVQLGGGLRTLEAIECALQLGVSRVILGTAAIETPDLVAEAVQRYGAARLGLAIDVRAGRVQARGWAQDTEIDALVLGRQAAAVGIRTAVFTSVERDGTGHGVDLAAAKAVAQATGLAVIASGGVAALAEVQAARCAGLSGIIIGRALYTGQIDLAEALAC